MEHSVIALRNKFADDIEEILQCPVCFETLSGTVPMCQQGHHVCVRCQPQMNCCPFCKSFFNGTRNYLAENLISKFDDIKISLIDPKNKLNKQVLQNVVCVQTQTDSSINTDNEMMTDPIPVEPIDDTINKPKEDPEFKTAPVVGKGKYPCRIGDCDVELPHGRMIPHIRYYHSKDLIEAKILNDCCYTGSWTLTYKFSDSFDRAILIPNMGLFFLNITINDTGSLHANVQIVNTRLIAQQFQCELDVTINRSSIIYKGSVLGCRTLNKLNEKCLFVNNLLMEQLLKKKKYFTCNLTLKRLHESEFLLKKGKNTNSVPMES